MSNTKTTRELVELLNDGNHELMVLIKDLDDTQMDTPGVQNIRSIKDILAHLTYWNDHGIEWIKSVYKGKTPVMPVNGINLSDIRDELAEINAEVHQRNRERPVEEVLNEYMKTFELVIEHVEKLEKRHLDMVLDYPWAREPVTGQTVVMWRYWHQQGHTKHIKTWVKKEN
jgi:hypothetical protein